MKLSRTVDNHSFSAEGSELECQRALYAFLEDVKSGEIQTIETVEVVEETKVLGTISVCVLGALRSAERSLQEELNRLTQVVPPPPSSRIVDVKNTTDMIQHAIQEVTKNAGR